MNTPDFLKIHAKLLRRQVFNTTSKSPIFARGEVITQLNGLITTPKNLKSSYQSFFNSTESLATYDYVQSQYWQLQLLATQQILKPAGLVHLDWHWQHIAGTRPNEAGLHVNMKLVFEESYQQGSVYIVESHLKHPNGFHVVQRSRYLYRPQKNKSSPVLPKPTSELKSENCVSIEHLSTGSQNEGLQYAKLATDFNPIHLHAIFSRLFGMKTPIVHGMRMLATVLSKLYVTDVSLHSRRQIKCTFLRPVPYRTNMAIQHVSSQKTSNTYILNPTVNTPAFRPALWVQLSD